jgi:phosphonatase-like hydrolase
MAPIKLVLFDITGTILQDTGNLLRAFGAALRTNGIEASHDELQEWRGAAKREVISAFVGRQRGSAAAADDGAVQRIYGQFQELLEADFVSHPPIPIAGAEAVFAWLRERGILLGATTGYHRKLADSLLHSVGWRDCFRTTVASDEVSRGRPAPYMIFRAMEAAGVLDVSQVVTVGDTPLDLQAGANAGVRGIVGVLSGAHTAERLRREPHTHLLPSIADLPRAMSAFGAG